MCLSGFFLIDCGEGTQMQLRKFKIKFQRINHIFISHLHGDHYFGLMGLLSSMHLLGRQNELHLYAPAPLKEIIDIQLKYSDTILNYPLVFHPLNFDSKKILFEDDLVKVSSFPLFHRIPTCGFLFEEKPKNKSIIKEKIKEYQISLAAIQSIREGNDFVTNNGQIIPNSELTYPQAHLRKYAYCSDTRYNEKLLEYVSNVDLLYHEATFLHELQNRAEITFHSTAKEAGIFASKANAKQLIIGHFSARYPDLNLLLAEAINYFPNTLLAQEGQSYLIHSNRI
ncbi:MAG: ribonuclease Z [Candidatus Woesearchaeota archaeon]|nr:MAG: ribonuclease Z [Candidatus Woesearchaeota archaeon]